MNLELPGPAGGISVTTGQGAGGPAPAGCPADPPAASHVAASPAATDPAATDPAAAVTALYREHALGLTRLALVMVRDRQAAEDIVQDAFCGLHRRWSRLRDTGSALPYVRSAVLNGCRSEFRRHKAVRPGRDGYEGYIPPAWSAESAALASAERREVLQALLRLPTRQREALVLRFYLDLSEADAASAMRVSRGTVKSTVARGLAALRELLGEQS
jgi:RNA polymerase sigma-70 factor (sigma-E family)